MTQKKKVGLVNIEDNIRIGRANADGEKKRGRWAGEEGGWGSGGEAYSPERYQFYLGEKGKGLLERLTQRYCGKKNVQHYFRGKRECYCIRSLRKRCEQKLLADGRICVNEAGAKEGYTTQKYNTMMRRGNFRGEALKTGA